MRLSSGAVMGLIMVTMLVGCASLDAPMSTELGQGASAGERIDRSPEDIVRERARERWQAAVAGEYEKVYAFTPPSYRGLVDYKRFRSTVGVASSLVSAEVLKVACETVTCVATVELKAMPLISRRHGQPVTAGYDEKWVFEDGSWWFFQQ